MQELFYHPDPQGRVRVVVVHRSDASCRRVTNHDEMMEQLYQVYMVDMDECRCYFPSS